MIKEVLKDFKVESTNCFSNNSVLCWKTSTLKPLKPRGFTLKTNGFSEDLIFMRDFLMDNEFKPTFISGQVKALSHIIRWNRNRCWD